MPSNNLRSEIIKVVNENTLLGEFKAVAVTDQILALIESKMPEKQRGCKRHKAPSPWCSSGECLVGEVHNECLDSVKLILRGSDENNN